MTKEELLAIVKWLYVNGEDFGSKNEWRKAFINFLAKHLLSQAIKEKKNETKKN